MIDDSTLQQQAHDDCLAHAQRTYEGAFFVEQKASSRRWDPVRRRHVFEQAMKIWRHFSEFEILLDRDNRPVGFIDHDKWVDCRWVVLSEEEIIDLVSQIGAFEGELAVTSTVRGQRDELEVDLCETRPHGKLRWYRVYVNPARRAIIALLPMRSELL